MAKTTDIKSPEARAHLEWLGYVQPVGLVVSIPALLEAQCYVNKNIPPEHNRFLGCLPRDAQENLVPEIHDLALFCQQVLGWEADDLVEIPNQPQSEDERRLEVVLPQYNETLRPTHAVPAFEPEEGQNPWLMLVQQLPPGTDFDVASEADSAKHWSAAPQAKFERLLRETDVPIGLLSNHRQLRLVYSPRGESSGHATFNIAEMTQVAGRPMFAALHMLLCAERMFSLGEAQRLPAVLENSRKYQNTVSTKLAEQVLAALYELIRGFQAANDVRRGELLRDVLASDPNHVYSGLLTVLMRLVFVMYAEDRDLLSSDPVYSNHYSVTGLFNRLREDAGRFPDTMDQRFGAWSQLVTLFRLVYEGGQHSEFHIPPRKGYLFDPERYPFLEGRQRETQPEEHPTIPRVSDGVVFRVLQNLLVLDGERLSYRTLDVEQIGSVYETVMGFNLEVAAGKSIAIKPVKSHGAPATINLEALLATAGKDRAKWLKEHADQKLGAADAKLLKAAESVDKLLDALDKKIAKQVTPRVVPSGAIVLQPSDERRRSGSHYTPRSLTEPIVRTTLEPILKQLLVVSDELVEQEKKLSGRVAKLKNFNKPLDTQLRRLKRRIQYGQAASAKQTPHPNQILELKVCDPAMGSGAFLVETCRQLGDELIKSWYAHDLVPADIPPDEDEVLYARRLVAQRCLYGVDKNVMAVDLAKLSLWLVTLAKDHAFTFLDHALRHGDSLVGLSREQIAAFHWDIRKRKAGDWGATFSSTIEARINRATEARAKILNAREDVPYRDQEQRMALADEALNVVRLTGDACVSAFFAGSKKKERETRCDELFVDVAQLYQNLKDQKLDSDVNNRLQVAADSLLSGEHPVPAFHWEIEFPEVFARENDGFDAFVGNPPFAGVVTLGKAMGDTYTDYLRAMYTGTGGKCDLVAFFFRRCFQSLRASGTVGLIATQTVCQGDTRRSGLHYISLHGTIYDAVKRMSWPGQASVNVSIIFFTNVRHPTDEASGEFNLNSYLLRYAEIEPSILNANDNVAFLGCKPGSTGYFMGGRGQLPSDEANEVLRLHPDEAALMKPYWGGAELYSAVDFSDAGRTIAFTDRIGSDCTRRFPNLSKVVKNSVGGGDRWWSFGRSANDLYEQIESYAEVLVRGETSNTWAFVWCDPSHVYSNKCIVFLHEKSWSFFGALQSRIHEEWCRLTTSTLGDQISYVPSDCFDTFPLPLLKQQLAAVAEAGETYYRFREPMVSEFGGMTEIYNAVNEPHETHQRILELRRLHGLMDEAVLRAYGWDDLAGTATCEFLLDYEEEDDEDLSAKKSKKKKPWRYRWPDEFRDEVLARLLELNEQRHQEELLSGKQLETEKETKPRKKAAKKPAKAKSKREEPALFSTTLDQEHRYLLMLLREFDGRAVSRRVLNAGMILMLDDALRRALLSNGQTAAGNGTDETAINQYLTDLSIDGYIEQLSSEHQQLWKITASAPSTSDASAEDSQRVAEVMEFLNREAETGNVTISEEVVDANVDLVPA